MLSCLGFGGIVLGFGLSSLLGWGSAGVICALVVGVVALVLYAHRQIASETPVLNLRAFSKGRTQAIGASRRVTIPCGKISCRKDGHHERQPGP